MFDPNICFLISKAESDTVFEAGQFFFFELISKLTYTTISAIVVGIHTFIVIRASILIIVITNFALVYGIRVRNAFFAIAFFELFIKIFSNLCANLHHLLFFVIALLVFQTTNETNFIGFFLSLCDDHVFDRIFQIIDKIIGIVLFKLRSFHLFSHALISFEAIFVAL